LTVLSVASYPETIELRVSGMNESLPVDIQQRIDAQLAMGIFKNAEDVLREAMEALERRQNGLRQLRELVATAEADVSAGKVGTFNREDTKRAVRQRLSEQGISD
jgi:Arc/MetJ-type ribon-helix-helix transcriptional regulator